MYIQRIFTPVNVSYNNVIISCINKQNKEIENTRTKIHKVSYFLRAQRCLVLWIQTPFVTFLVSYRSWISFYDCYNHDIQLNRTIYQADWNFCKDIRIEKQSGRVSIETETGGIIENIFQASLLARAAHSIHVFAHSFSTLCRPVATQKKQWSKTKGNETLDGRRARVDGETWKKKHGRSVTIEEHRNPLEEIISRD